MYLPGMVVYLPRVVLEGLWLYMVVVVFRLLLNFVVLND